MAAAAAAAAAANHDSNLSSVCVLSLSAKQRPPQTTGFCSAAASTGSGQGQAADAAAASAACEWPDLGSLVLALSFESSDFSGQILS
jgi:hypothetical protein